MDRIYGSVTLRPTRIAFLVKPNQESISLVRKIMEYSTCLWGGVFNPIIPVSKTVPRLWRQDKAETGMSIADGYIRFFEPDVFVEAQTGLAKEVGVIEDEHFTGRRVVSLKDFCETSARGVVDFRFGLNIFDVYKDLYREEFRFVSRDERRVTIVDSAERDFFAAAVFGAFPAERKLNFVRRGYMDAFKPDVLHSGVETFLKVYRKGYLTPLNATTHHLDMNYENRDDPTFFVFDPDKTVDLIDFWNMRQFCQGVFPVNLHWFKEISKFMRGEIKKNHRPLPGNKNGVMILTTVEFARSISRDLAKSLFEENLSDLPSGSVILKFWHDPIWRSDWRSGGIQPRRVKLESEKVGFDETIVGENLNLQYQSLSPKFASRYSFVQNSARWANVIKLGDEYFGNSNIALRYPPNIKDPKFPRLGIDRTLSSREGLVVLNQFKLEKAGMTLPRQQDAITEWLKSVGISAAPSSAGRNAEQVLRSVGGPKGCSILADEGTLKLLDKMAKSIHREEDGTTAEYPERTATVSEWKEVVGRRSNRLFSRAKISDFVDRGILRLGLGLKCPNCAKDNWYNLTNVDYQLNCERCSSSFAFPQADLKFNEGDWQYRAIGPFSAPNYANGAYATALTIRFFSSVIDMHKPPATFSTGLDISLGNQKFEVDFFGWYTEGRKFWVDPNPVVVFGESKSFGSQVFKDKDISRLKNLAELMPGSYVVFSTLKTALASEEKQRLAQFAEWGRGLHKNGQQRALVIILTGLELFADWHLKPAWESHGGKHAALIKHASVHVDDLWVLADLTQQLYLEMPSYHEWKYRQIVAKQKRPRKIANQATTEFPT